MSTCLLYRTHVWNNCIESNYNKLKNELSGFIDVYLSIDPSYISIPADHVFHAHQTKYRHLVDNRHITAAYCGHVQMSNPELAIMDFHDKYPQYDQYYLFENDVFTKGSFRKIFEIIQEYPQEYLAHHIKTSTTDFIRTNGKNCWLSKPFSFEMNPMWMANHPLVRLSKNAMQILDREFSNGLYGFCEVLIPSVLIGKYNLTCFDIYNMGISTYERLNRQESGKQAYSDIVAEDFLQHPIKRYDL